MTANPRMKPDELVIGLAIRFAIDCIRLLWCIQVGQTGCWTLGKDIEIQPGCCWNDLESAFLELRSLRLARTLNGMGQALDSTGTTPEVRVVLLAVFKASGCCWKGHFIIEQQEK